MKKVNAMEMRTVEGGKWVYCPVCGKGKNVKWGWAVIFRGWNSVLNQARNTMRRQHYGNGRVYH
ncbi:MAG: hypothetical protein IJ027_07675 [Oscillospiraceae bacterium]|nr:hypothetical protein [Oscillospiraceae bacterium]